MWKKQKVKLITILVVLMGMVILSGCVMPSESQQIAPLQVSLLKVGKADAIVLHSDVGAMVIDAGEEDDGAEIVALLQNLGIQRVDVLVITHFDRDHVGGADTLVEAMEIGQVLLPAYQGDGSEYLDFMEALHQKGIVPQELTQPVTLALMGATVLVEPPSSYVIKDSAGEYDNNFSLITTVVHGDNRLLFMGDAEKQRIRQWLAEATVVDCDWIKMPHHGVYTKALDELLQAVTPEDAVICSSAKHPADEQTLELLKQNNIGTLQTKDGDITVISDGTKLKIHQ